MRGNRTRAFRSLAVAGLLVMVAGATQWSSPAEADQPPPTIAMASSTFTVPATALTSTVPTFQSISPTPTPEKPGLEATPSVAVTFSASASVTPVVSGTPASFLSVTATATAIAATSAIPVSVVTSVNASPTGSIAAPKLELSVKASGIGAVTQVAVGSGFTCALVTGGTAWCWGTNQYGQLGDGTRVDRLAPARVSGSTAFSSLSSGQDGACGLVASGLAWCWGTNWSGQLGDGTTEHRSSPVEVSGSLRFASLSNGGSHACGLDFSGKAYCWGANWSGQLGDGSMDQRTTPVPVSGDLTFKSIAAGRRHTCAVTAAGDAHCWGPNDASQLGLGSTAACMWACTTPQLVSTTAKFVRVASGDDHTCAITAQNEAFCWGLNSKGQTGIGSSGLSSPMPVTQVSTPTTVTGGMRFSQVVSGGYHTCGLSVAGSMHCWGSNASGELGDGSGTDQSGPTAVAGGNAFTSIAAGSDTSCGISVGGRLFCWGRNRYGQVGDQPTMDVETSPLAVAGGLRFREISLGGDQACGVTAIGVGYCFGSRNSNRPAAVVVSSGMTPTVPFASIDTGHSHACGLSDSLVAYCWGNTGNGRLGFSPTLGPWMGGSGSWSQGPVDGGLTMTLVAAGGAHTCALNSRNQAYCWGYNSNGQVGDGNIGSPANDRMAPVAVSGNREFSALVTGLAHSCGLTAAGGAFCWGLNASGQLGDGSQSDRAVPVPVVGGLTFSKITAGDSHTCGLTTSGATYCWGANGGGQLGDGTGTGRRYPVAVGAGLTFRSIGAGKDHTCGVTIAGIVHCWGANDTGQLGDGTITGHAVPAPVLVGTAFASVWAGNGFSCALTPAGSAFCWGLNYAGQLGIGTYGSDRATPVMVTAFDAPVSTGASPTPMTTATATVLPSPTRRATALTFKEISSGYQHTCGLTLNGAAYCWGANLFGQVGDGTSGNDRPLPLAVRGGYTFASITAGGNHTCAMTPAGEAYCWGANANGQLGDGTTVASGNADQRSVPQRVSGDYIFNSLSAGGSHTCGITAGLMPGETRTYCWGANSSGQLGDGLSYGYNPCWNWPCRQPFTDSKTPLLVSGNISLVSVSAGAEHTCGLTSDLGMPAPVQRVYCWGSNTSQQLGVPTQGYGTWPSPAEVSQSLSVISAGPSGTCGVSLKLAYCWGTIMSRQTLDNGSSSGTSFGTPTLAGPSGVAYAKVATGYRWACGLDGTGKAYCWGGNRFGQLGSGVTDRDVAASDLASAAVPVAGDRRFTRLTAGYSHACALDMDGVALCWGSNTHGQLGTGVTASVTKPTSVAAPPALVKLAAGDYHTCGLTSAGRAYCWGDNQDYSTGTGLATKDIATPQAVTGSATYSNLALGLGYSCGVNTAGEVGCWGMTDSTPTLKPDPVTYVSITAAFRHRCGINPAGRAFCTGTNSYGALGNGSNAMTSETTAVTGGLTFTSVSASLYHSCGLTASKQVYCWGSNLYGEVGDSTYDDRNSPVAIAGGREFKAIATGASHSCAILSLPGTVQGADIALTGAVNSNPSDSNSETVAAPTVPAWDGAAYCWGRVASGRLGTGQTIYDSYSRSSWPTMVKTDQAFVEIGAGWQHTCARTSSGTAYCWGDNAFGQLGDETLTMRETPVAVAGGLKFASLAVGGYHTCGVLTSGATLCWGRNDVGQLGVGSLGYASAPVPVSGADPIPAPGDVVARSVRLSNVRDSGFTVTWTTDTPAVGALRWGPDNGQAPMNTAADRRGATANSTVHSVAVTGLASNTKYAFELIPGPWTNTASAVRYTVTTGLVLPVKSPDLVYGSVLRKDGGVPSGVIVHVTASNAGTMSAPLSTLVTTADAKTWLLDLGSLRSTVLDGSFTYADSTVLTVQADGGVDGTATGTVTVADARMGKLSLTLNDDVRVAFQAGWNLIALPGAPATSLTSAALCTALNGTSAGSALEIDRWESGGWSGHVCGVPANTFPIEMGRGYFVRMAKPATWTFSASRIFVPDPVSLQAGWNLVGVAVASSLPSIADAACTAMDIASGAGTAIEVNRWSAGAWDGHRCGVPANVFAMEAGRGFFVRVSRPTAWAPTGAVFGVSAMRVRDAVAPAASPTPGRVGPSGGGMNVRPDGTAPLSEIRMWSAVRCRPTTLGSPLAGVEADQDNYPIACP